jgi:hypothetical protein
LLTLESEALRIQMWPRMGGKIVSIVVRSHGPLEVSKEGELLHPPIHTYNTATDTSGFEFSDAGGWDECLPSVAACSFQGVEVSDHGDVWRRPWHASLRDKTLLAEVNTLTAPLRFSRRISLDGSTMHLRYSVTNAGSHGADFLWSAHPLFQVEEGDRILLPESVDEVRVESSSVKHLARAGSCSWPVAEVEDSRHLDLSTVGPRDGITFHKLFAGPLTTGWCGLYRAQLKLGIVMRFDPGQTPFAGLWICQGAWPPGSTNGTQYTVALEPTTSPCDALDRAATLGFSQHLSPQAEMSWPLQLEVFGSHTPVRYEEFVQLASGA